MMHRIPLIWLLVAITLSQALIGQFVMFGIPLFLRESGAGSEVTGLIFLAAIPYVARFVWAPLVDHYGLGKMGHYRGWLMGSQSVVTVCLVCLWLLGDPRASAFGTVLMLPPLMIALGTQLVALAGATTTLLGQSQYGRAASLQGAAAGMAGFLLGAGVLYLLGDLGWKFVAGTIALQSCLCLLAIIVHPVDRGKIKPRTRRLASSFAALLSIFRRRHLGLLFAVVTVTTVGIDIGYGLKSIILSDAGLSVQDAGLWGIVLANLAGMMASLAARHAVNRFAELDLLLGLGLVSGLWTLFFAGLLANAAPTYLAIMFIIGAVSLVFAGAAVTQSLLMRIVDRETAATEIAVFGAVGGVAALLVNALASSALDKAGLPVVLLTGGSISLVGALAGSVIARRANLGEMP